MILLQKAKVSSILKRALEISLKNHVDSTKTSFSASGLFHIVQNPRFYAATRTAQPKKVLNFCGKSSDGADNSVRVTLTARKNAAAALLDYFYCTRGLRYTDAENMSKNAPRFLKKLMKKIDTEGDVGRSIARFLRYHPINEFEPFFESLGLEPSEYHHLLPRDKMFLDDDALLLENHYVLCSYGIDRKKIGKIYLEATEVFRLDIGVLQSKIQAYMELGFSNSFVYKVIVCSPRILVGDTNMDFVKVLEILRSMAFDISWVEEHLSEGLSYKWSTMHQVLSLFRESGLYDDELRRLISQHPGIIFENSGERTITLVSFQMKCGSSMTEICSLFRQYPEIDVGTFVSNLRKCFMFLNEIEMEENEITKIIRSHSVWLGTCSLKKTSSLLGSLNSGKARLCQIVQENPQEIKKWVLGSKVQKLPDKLKDMKSKMMKHKFLLDLGYVKNSKEWDRAFKAFRGRGSELKERFDFLVTMGLEREDVATMVRRSPKILSQTIDVLEAKIDYLVNELGFPLSTLINFPSYLGFTIQRVKLRFVMYNWLLEKGKVDRDLALSTIVVCSDKYFVGQFVHRHPDGPKVWEDLKNQHVPRS